MTKKTSFLAFLILCMVLFFQTADAREVRTNSRNVFTNINTFNQPVEFKSGLSVESTAPLEVQSEATFDDGAYFNDELVMETYTTSGASSYTVAGVNYVFTGSAPGSGATELVIILPEITAQLDGYKITFKSIGAGVSWVVITGCSDTNYTPNSRGLLETPFGTTSAVTMFGLTANNGVSAFVADYVSGSTGIWRLIYER